MNAPAPVDVLDFDDIFGSEPEPTPIDRLAAACDQLEAANAAWRAVERESIEGVPGYSARWTQAQQAYGVARTAIVKAAQALVAAERGAR